MLVCQSTWVSQKFCNISFRWGTIQQLWMLCQVWEMLNLPDTLWVLLSGFASMAWSTASESMVLDLPDLDWSRAKFLEPSVYCIVITCIFTFHTRNGFGSRIRLPCTFICVAFKSHSEWSNTQRFSVLTVTILPTEEQPPPTVWTVIYVLRISSYQNISKLLTHPNVSSSIAFAVDCTKLMSC